MKSITPVCASATRTISLAVADFYVQPPTLSFFGVEIRSRERLTAFYEFLHSYVRETVTVVAFAASEELTAVAAVVRIEAFRITECPAASSRVSRAPRPCPERSRRYRRVTKPGTASKHLDLSAPDVFIVVTIVIVCDQRPAERNYRLRGCGWRMNRTELYAVLDRYLAALASRNPSRVEWSDRARTSENNVFLAAGDGLWGTITGLGDYRLAFADPQSGEVGYFGTVIEPLEESAFTVRLKVDSRGRIEEAETIVVRQSDSGIKFENPRYWNKPILDARAVEPSSRAEAIALADGYFSTLERNDGTIRTRFHPDCNRVENGVQTTNNPDFAKIVPVSALGCEAQFRMGNYRYDDALRSRRFPLVDEERGLVLAYGFIDHSGRLGEYQLTDGRTVMSPVRRPHSFYLAELFKIDHGMIMQIEAGFITVPYRMPSPWNGI